MTKEGFKMYMINGFLKFVEQDEYKNGCLPDTGHTASADILIKAETKEQIIEKVKEFFDVKNDCIELNACEESGRIDIQIMENDLAEQPSPAAIEAWKKGKFNLWLANYSGQLEKVESAKF